MGNIVSDSRKGMYTNANTMISNIKFEYNDEVNLVRDIYMEVKGYNKDIFVKYSVYDLDKYGLNIKILVLSKLSNLVDINDNIPKADKSLIHNIIKDNINTCFAKNNINISKIIHYSDNLEITIDDYIFKLISKKNNRDSRLLILVESRKIDNSNKRRIIFYRSNSDSGLLRFAVCSNLNHGCYLKNISGKQGIDYITETIIHIKLQGFIFDNINKIPYSFYDNEKNKNFENNKEIFLKLNNKFFFADDSTLDKDHINIMNNLTNNFQISPSNIFKFYNFNSYDNIPYFNLLKFNISCGEVIAHYSIINMKKEFIKITPDNPRYKYIQIMNKIINDILPTDEIKSDINYYKIYYNILSNYLREIGLTIKGNLEYITKYISTLDECIIKFNVYSIEIKIEDDMYILYCALYRVWNKEIYLGEFNTTINIVRSDNKILPTGQNNFVISMGNYICKVINYKEHTNIGENSSLSNLTNSCEKAYSDIDIDGKEGEYLFTGHCSHNVYPLNLISFPLWQDINLDLQESYVYFPPEY